MALRAKKPHLRSAGRWTLQHKDFAFQPGVSCRTDQETCATSLLSSCDSVLPLSGTQCDLSWATSSRAGTGRLVASPPHPVEPRAPEPYSSFLTHCPLQTHRSLWQGRQPSSMCQREETGEHIFSQRGEASGNGKRYGKAKARQGHARLLRAM